MEPEPEPEPEPRSNLTRTRSRTDHSLGLGEQGVEPLASEADRAARSTEAEAILQRRAGPKEAWENRLSETWRGNDGGAELRRRAELLSGTSIFEGCTNKELRMLAIGMEQMSYSDGEMVFAQGDAPNGLYVLESGACAVHVDGIGVVDDLTEPGVVFGEMCLFLATDRRTASIITTEPTRCLRCSGGDAIKVMEKAWGDREVLEERADMLAAIDLFSTLGKANLMMLATSLSKHVFSRPGIEIVKEGKRGENMFIVKVGNPCVHVRGVGRVSELTPGECFGEVLMLGGSKFRLATVTTTDMHTEVYSLYRHDLLRLTTPEQRMLMLEKQVETYDARTALRQSTACVDIIDRFWEVLRRLTEHDASQHEERGTARGRWLVAKRALALGKRGGIDANAYKQLHCRISRLLVSAEDFDLERAEKIADADWCEDMTHGANSIRVAMWVEKVKAKLLKALGSTVAKNGWHELFESMDADGSGEVDFEEFREAVRDRMKVPTRLTLLAQKSMGAAGRRLVNKTGISIENDELEEIFSDVDKDGGGSVSSQELVDYLASDSPAVKGKTRQNRLQLQRRRDLKLLVQEACREEIDRIGWMHLFAQFDSDGSGELDVNEFTTIIRDIAKVGTKVISDENIKGLFQAIDESEDGVVDAKELQSFLSERPFEQLMPYDTFLESMFQLAQSWVEDEGKEELFESCDSEEEKYATMLSFLFNKITTPTGKLKVLQLRLDGFSAKGHYELVDKEDTDAAVDISGISRDIYVPVLEVEEKANNLQIEEKDEEVVAKPKQTQKSKKGGAATAAAAAATTAAAATVAATARKAAAAAEKAAAARRTAAMKASRARYAKAAKEARTRAAAEKAAAARRTAAMKTSGARKAKEAKEARARAAAEARAARSSPRQATHMTDKLPNGCAQTQDMLAQADKIWKLAQTKHGSCTSVEAEPLQIVSAQTVPAATTAGSSPSQAIDMADEPLRNGMQTIDESEDNSYSKTQNDPAENLWQLETARASVETERLLHGGMHTADILAGTGHLRAQAVFQQVYVKVCRKAPASALMLPSPPSWKAQIKRRPSSAPATSSNRLAWEARVVDARNGGNNATYSGEAVLEGERVAEAGTSVVHSEQRFFFRPSPPLEPKTPDSRTPRRSQWHYNTSWTLNSRVVRARSATASPRLTAPARESTVTNTITVDCTPITAGPSALKCKLRVATNKYVRPSSALR
jgi:Ca2+-binding EF-hand superfamily protein/CRP-like cAMP-binding protein